MQCPRCGRLVSAAMKFCGECGAAMPQLTAPPAPPTVADARPSVPPLPMAARNIRAKLPGWLRLGLWFFTFAAISLVLAIVWLAWFLQTPTLRRIDPDTYRWGPPSSRNAQTTAIYFDNGTDDTLDVTIERQGRFSVAAGSRIKLEEPSGPIVFRVMRAATGPARVPSSAVAAKDDADALIREDLRESHVYVYNPGACFDYIIQSHMYSSLGSFGVPAPEPRTIAKTAYFDAGEIAFAFENAPEGVSLSPHVVAVTKYSLVHKDP